MAVAPPPVAKTLPSLKAPDSDSDARAATPPAPASPPVFRHFGELVGPDGAEVVYIALRDEPTIALPGAAAGGGFVVEAVEAQRIRLRSRATGQQVIVTRMRDGDRGAR